MQAHDIGQIPSLDELTNPFAAYTASKRIALQKANKFVEESSPEFDLIHILPSVILGRNELATSVSDVNSGTNRYVINTAKGVDAPAPMLGASVFVNDCAEIHVLALDAAVKGNQNYLATAGSVIWNDVNEITRDYFGEDVKANVFKLGGIWPLFLWTSTLLRLTKRFS